MQQSVCRKKLFGGTIACSLLLLVTISPVHAAVYRWVDDKGVTHYSDAGPDDKSSKDIKVQPDVPKSTYQPPPRPSKTASPGKTPPARAETSAANASVTLYVTSWCKHCKKAKAFLNAQGISYRAFDIEENPAARARMQAHTANRGVPFAIINGHKITGFSESTYRQALSAGE